MGNFKDTLIEKINIDQVVKALVKSSGDDEDAVIDALSGLMLANHIGLSYLDTIITPGEKSERIDLYITGAVITTCFLQVKQTNWKQVNVDPDKYAEGEITTKTKDGEETIEQGTIYEKKAPKIKEVVEKYERAIPFREFQIDKVELEALLKDKQMPLPDSWIDIDDGIKKKDDKFQIFRDMKNLAWNDVELILLTNWKIKINARGESTISHYAALGFTKAPYMTLCKLAANERVGSKEKHNVIRIKNALKDIMGIQKNPFEEYVKSIGYKPIFKLSEKLSGSIEEHGDSFRDDDGLNTQLAADYQREKPVPIDDDYEIGSGFNKKGDNADTWLKDNDPDYKP